MDGNNIQSRLNITQRKNFPVIRSVKRINVSLPYFKKKPSSADVLLLDCPDCPACKNGHKPTVHKCIFCSKAVHNFSPSSIPAPGSEEGHSQQRICYRCNPKFSQNSMSQTITSNRNPKIGSKNFGNACYLNSVIQCLNSTIGLANFFCTDLLHSNEDNANDKCVTNEIADIMKKMWQGKNTSLSAKKLKQIIGNFNQSFKDNRQQDAQELLQCLLDKMHEELIDYKVLFIFDNFFHKC